MKMLKDKKNRKLRIISFVILFLAAIVFLAPYFWMLSNSFKSTKEILLEPTNMLPKQFTLDGYVKVITDSPFFRWMGNSLFVTVIDTLVVLFTSSLIGFVLSKYKFKLNKFLFYVILITMMMPTAAMMIPNFLLISKLGWYDKIISLVVPTFVNAFGIFLCKQFIDDMPKELFECAMLDNAGPFTIYRKIVLPGIRPALGSLTIFTSENMTLPLAMSYFSTQHLSDLSATMAAASLIMIPASIVFIIFQKQFIKGITMTGMK